MTRTVQLPAGAAVPASMPDLRKHPREDVLERVEGALGVRLDRGTFVRKRRSVGAATDCDTWVRIEVRGVGKLHGQGFNGVEAAAVVGAAELLAGRARSGRDDQSRDPAHRPDDTGPPDHRVTAVFPDFADTTVTEWTAAHADLSWANLTSPECWLLD